MKKTGTTVFLFSLFLTITLVFFGCKGGGYTNSGLEDADGGGDGGGSQGTLTVNNCPENVHVYVCTNSPITAQMDLANKLTSFLAQNSEQFSSSPFSLKNFGNMASTWTGTGTYLVYIICEDSSIGNVFKTDVSFSNGSATINYNSMTNQSSLPAM
jgi:hypothetical protein